MEKSIILLALIVLALTGCGNDASGEQTYYEQTHYGAGKLNMRNEQVWIRNGSTNRLSHAYEKYDEKDYDIIVLSEYDEETGEDNTIGSGTINGGKLNFNVDEPVNLLKWDKLKVFFNIIVEGEGWEVDIDDTDVRGTFIEILTRDEGQYILIREGLSGTASSISDETVFFLYVSGDCAINGKSKKDKRIMYTFNPFTLNLRKGWNTVYYKQTYTSSGRSSFFMDIRNPDLKWVLIPTVPTK
jgi:hypothetical protein